VLRVLSALLLIALACGPKSMSARRIHSEKLANEADDLVQKAEGYMRELEPNDAQEALDDAKKVLSDADAPLYPEYEMLMGRIKEDEARLPDVRRVREARDLQAAITQRKAKIEEEAARLKQALKALDAPGVEKGAVDDAADAAGDLLDELKDGLDLEPKDKPYAEWARKQRELFEKAKEPIQLARARVDFASGPGELRTQAQEKAKEARGLKVAEEKRAAYAEAKKLYEKCQDACRKLLTANPAVSRLPIVVAGKRMTPEGLDSACSAEWQDVDKAMARVKLPPPPAPPKAKPVKKGRK
jgi:hypothetical protein